MQKRRGCGCFLVALGSILLLVSIVFGIGMCVADERAGERHQAWVTEYNKQVEALDSIQDEALRDSLFAELPTPYVRQGGFASIFGIIFGGAGVLLACIPLIVGIILMNKKRKNN